MTLLAILLVLVAFSIKDFWPSFACLALAAALLIADRIFPER